MSANTEVVFVRIDAARFAALTQTAEFYGVSVDEMARVFFEVEQDAPRVEKILQRLRVYDGRQNGGVA